MLFKNSDRIEPTQYTVWLSHSSSRKAFLNVVDIIQKYLIHTTAIANVALLIKNLQRCRIPGACFVVSSLCWNVNGRLRKHKQKFFSAWCINLLPSTHQPVVALSGSV